MTIDTEVTKSSTEVITLGTCGGPKWRLGRSGISTAVVVGGETYVVDFGYGSGRQLAAAGCDLSRLRAGFVTHLHSDHISDLANLLLYGWYHGLADLEQPMQIYGPGSRGEVPPALTQDVEPAVISPDHPMPGFSDSAQRLLEAYATDLNDRMRDNARPHPDQLLRFHDIELPAGTTASPDNPCPPMRPFNIYEDERVRVSAILVQHSPMWPSYAYRIDTDDGAVVVSGDTGPCENLETLADGATVLVHEVIDETWIEANYAGHPRHEREAMVTHHLTAHTSVPALGRAATRANVGTLVLTHYVPGDAPRERWARIKDHFSGRLVIAEDLERIAVSG